MRTGIAMLLLVLFALSLPLVSAQDTDAWVCPEGFAGQTLNVFNWSTYIADNTISDFIELCDVTVTYDVYDSDGDMMNVIRQGNPGYDIVVPSDYAYPLMAAEGLLVPLNLDNIPNTANLLPTLLDDIEAEETVYALPYLLGTFGVGYNISTVGEEITTWEQFFSYDGPVVWIDDPRTMMSIALTMVGADPNTSDPDELDAAKQFLIDHSANVVAISTDDGQELLARGEVDMAVEYNGDIYQIALDCDCEDFAYAIPQEGSGYSSGFVAIPVGAQNPALAEVFIDYLLTPQVGADIANFTAYPSPNQAAIDAGLIDPELLNNPAIYPDEDALEVLYFLEPRDEATEELYGFIWDEIKIALSVG